MLSPCVNSVIVLLSSVALVIAALVLTYSVASRYFLHFSTDWQDELSVFLIVGAVFMSAAAIQARRGHVGDRGDRRPAVAAREPRSGSSLVDVASFLFCGFFAWKSWTLLDEAWIGQLPFGLDLGPAAVDSLFADDGRA